MPESPLRVGIVNDLRLAVEALRRVVASAPSCEVAWVAMDGQEAVEACRRDRPDLVLMDLIMPVMDGVESTRRIMAECPCPIVVVTATVDGNYAKVYDALGHGALDAVNTPVLGRDGSLEGAAALLRKIELVRRMHRVRPRSESPAATPAATLEPGGGCRPAAAESSRPTAMPMVAIGASTGGPQAVATVLAQLPAAFESPILLVQHVDAEFVPGLVRWLAGQSGRRVVVADPGPIEPGTVHVAGRNLHLVVSPHGRLEVSEEPRESLHRPSVDVLFESLAANRRFRGIALLLTGMGRDGAAGMLALRRQGWCTIAQDRESSVVWGMPGAAVQLGAAAEVLPLPMIAARIAREGRPATAAGGR